MCTGSSGVSVLQFTATFSLHTSLREGGPSEADGPYSPHVTHPNPPSQDSFSLLAPITVCGETAGG